MRIILKNLKMRKIFENFKNEKFRIWKWEKVLKILRMKNFEFENEKKNENLKTLKIKIKFKIEKNFEKINKKWKIKKKI